MYNKFKFWSEAVKYCDSVNRGLESPKAKIVGWWPCVGLGERTYFVFEPLDVKKG